MRRDYEAKVNRKRAFSRWAANVEYDLAIYNFYSGGRCLAFDINDYAILSIMLPKKSGKYIQQLKDTDWSLGALHLFLLKL